MPKGKTQWYYSAQVEPFDKIEKNKQSYSLSGIREWLETLDTEARTVLVYKSHTGEFAAEFKRGVSDIWYRTCRRNI